MKKRILSILLVLVMVIGMIPFSALSASAADTEDLRLFGGKETSKVETTDYGGWYEDDNGHIVSKDLYRTTLYWIDRVNLTSAYQNPNTWSELKLTANFPTGSQPPSLSHYYTNSFVSNLEYVWFGGITPREDAKNTFYRTNVPDGGYQLLFNTEDYYTGTDWHANSQYRAAAINQWARLYDTSNQSYYDPEDSNYPVGSYIVEYRLLTKAGGSNADFYDVPNITFDSGERMKVTLDGATLAESNAQYVPNTYYLVETDWDDVDDSWYYNPVGENGSGSYTDSVLAWSFDGAEKAAKNAKENSSPNTLYHRLYAYGEKFYVYDEKPEIKTVLVNGESVADGATYVSNSKSVTVKTTYDSELSQALQDYGCTVKYKTSLNGVDYSNVSPSTSNGNGTSTQTYVQNVNSGSSLTFKSWLEVTWPDGSKDRVDERTTNVTYTGVKNVSVSAAFSGTPANATSNTDGVNVTDTKWYKWVESGSTAGYVEMSASDTIKEGALYKCEVTVAEDGDKLASGYTVKINGHEAEKKYGTNHTWVYETRLEGTTSYVEVNDIDLPESYTNPDFTYNDEEGAAYHWDVVQVEWFECDQDGHKLSDALPADHIFEKGGYYRVEVTVVPETNWQFHGSQLSFYINGKAAMPLHGYNKAYPDSVTGYLVYNTADIEGNYELFVYDDSLSGSAKDIYIKDGQYLGSDATAPSDTKPASGGYAYYKDGVLELNGYDNEKAHFIFEELALELWLIGDNTIGAIYDNEFGMASGNLETRQGNLVINANPGGELVIASNPLDAYANIQVKDLYFKGGDVTSCLANGTYGAAVQLNGDNLYLEKGTAAYVSDSSDFATATKWDGTTDISDYENVWLKTVGTCRVDFLDDDNTVLEMVRVTEGSTVSEPDAPVKEGYEFIGWYTDDGDKFDFSTPITEDIVLTARYEQLTVISEVNITVTAPAVGATPSTTCKVETAGVTASISWNEVVTAGEQYSGSVTTFEAGKQYATFVFVEAKDGYYLTDDVVIKVNGKAAFLYAGINIVEFDALPGGNSGVTVNCIGDIDYTVSGNVVTVDHEVACKVGYLDGTAYKAITAVANGDGTYSFTAPAGVTEVLLVVKGDVSGDGFVTVADKMPVARSLLLTTHPAYQALNTIQTFAGDMDNNGSVIVADKMTLARSMLLTTHPAYQALTW